MTTTRGNPFSTIAQGQEALAVLAEFVWDCDGVDADYLREDWPDLHITYHKARALLKQVHPKRRHGQCPICLHYGDDCTGIR